MYRTTPGDEWTWTKKIWWKIQVVLQNQEVKLCVCVCACACVLSCICPSVNSAEGKVNYTWEYPGIQGWRDLAETLIDGIKWFPSPSTAVPRGVTAWTLLLRVLSILLIFGEWGVCRGLSTEIYPRMLRFCSGSCPLCWHLAMTLLDLTVVRPFTHLSQ